MRVYLCSPTIIDNGLKFGRLYSGASMARSALMPCKVQVMLWRGPDGSGDYSSGIHSNPEGPGILRQVEVDERELLNRLMGYSLAVVGVWIESATCE